MITAAVESFEAALVEFKALSVQHYDDLSLHKAEGIPLSPQWHAYIERERNGMMVFVALRRAGALIGYFIGFVAPGLHYSTCLTCTPDIFFIAPDHRGAHVGALRLFRAVERELRRRGVMLWVVGEKIHKPMGRMLKAMGFNPIETSYAKWLMR